MKSDDILAQLAAGGEVEAHGGFSIDKEKAREKMRQFQLSDPRHYVLMLVQAAVHQGATRIDFQIDADDMEVWFDGEGYSRADLDDLFVSMFGDRGESNLRSRQELAVALNGALALNPRWVRVWSHRAEEAASLQLRPGSGALEPAQACPSTNERGTRVHVKQRFRPGLALRFVENLQGTIAEEAILKDRARYAELPVILDGGRISSGFRLGTVAGRIDIEAKGMRGCCGFWTESDPPPARLDVLNAGVWLSTHQLHSFPLGFVAMVDSPALRKDVSQVDVLRDDAYEAMIGQLGVSLERSLLAIVEPLATDPSGWGAVPASFRSRLPTLIAERVAAPGRLEPLGDVLPMYLSLPIWQRMDGEWVSTASLQGPGGVDFVSRPQGDRQGFADAIRAESEEIRAALRAIFAEAVRDRTSAYEAAAARAEQKAKVLSRDWSTSLGDGLYLAREAIVGEGIRGEVGIRRTDREDSIVQLVYQGKLLESIVLDRKHVVIPGFVAVVEAPFEPTSDWTRSRRNEALAWGLHAVAEATVRALDTVGRTPPVPLHPSLFPPLRALATLVCRGAFARSLYLAAGFSKQRASRWVNKFGEVVVQNSLEEPHPLLRLPLFPQLAGPPMSLAQCRDVYSSENPVKVLTPGKHRRGTFEGYAVCDQAGRTLLRRVLGTAAVEDGQRAYEAELAAEAWRRKPPEPFEVFGETLHTAAFSIGGVEVKVGLLAPSSRSADTNGSAAIRVMKERRSIDFVTLPSAVGNLVMVVDWADAPVKPDYSGLRGESHPPLQKVVDAAGAELLNAILDAREARDTDATVMSGLRRLALAPFLQPGWLQAFDACHAAHGPKESTPRLVTVLRHAVKSDKPLALELVRGVLEGTGPKARKQEADAGLEALAHAVAAAWSDLREAPMLRALSKPCSIAAVLEDLKRHDRALVMDAANMARVHGEVPRVVLVADKAEHAELARVFGPELLADGRAWYDRWQAREAFEQQAKVDLELPAAEVLVKVDAKGELQGEIGLPRAFPSRPSAHIVACRRRRRVCDVVINDARASFVGVMQAESFGVGREFTSLSGEDIARIAAACRDAWPRLAEALAQAWPEFDEQERRWGRVWGRALLELLVAERGKRALSDPGPRALVDLPLFEHLDGTFWELDAILDGSGHDESVYWARATSDADRASLPRLVFLDEPHVKPLLMALVEGLSDYDKIRRQEQERDANRASALNMPTARRADAVEQIEISGRGLTGELWIDPMLDHGAVALGDGEKVAGYSDVSTLFVVGGAVSGPAVVIDDAWDSASLGARGGELLQQKARELYERVHERFDPMASDRSFKWLRDQSALRGLVERMHEQWSAGRKPGDGPTRRLYGALKQVPLFELVNGRSVSLDQREKLNQPELPPSPVVNAFEEKAESVVESKSEKKVDPKPPAKPEPAPPTPEAILLDAIRTELRIVRRGSPGMFSNAMLDLLRVQEVRSGVLAEFDEGAVFVNLRHPVAKLALDGEGPKRGRAISIAASAVFSAFNAGLDEVTDDHEVQFHALHAQHLAT